MPGPNYIDSIQNFYRVYSGVDDESADSVERFLRTIISKSSILQSAKNKYVRVHRVIFKN